MQELTPAALVAEYLTTETLHCTKSPNETAKQPVVEAVAVAAVILVTARKCPYIVAS